MARTLKEEIESVLASLDKKLEIDRDRGATPKEVVLREYIHGRRLFSPAQVRRFTGAPSAHGVSQVSLNEITKALHSLGYPKTMIAVAVPEDDEEYSIYFLYKQPS